MVNHKEGLEAKSFAPPCHKKSTVAQCDRGGGLPRLSAAPDKCGGGILLLPQTVDHVNIEIEVGVGWAVGHYLARCPWSFG